MPTLSDPTDGCDDPYLAEVIAGREEDPWRGLCEQLYSLVNHKREYYSCREHPLANALGVREQGITPWIYQVARIGEKVRRLRGLSRTIVPQEAIRKTLMDIAGHALVAVACLDTEKEETDEPHDS